MELTITIHEEDGSYWAEVAELPGCFAAGHSLDELADSLQEAVELYGDGSDVPDLPAHPSLRIERIHAVV